ncbi:PREDICTED: putative F-box/LRR-repeat protein 23 [Nicotiana attenuata]|uniref:F-boxlrr-repeat protein 23 n=1 Tax=Nicotiana attenuata TaxID=49451 RepID=A0A314L8E5_NICAT|nr:PREDICTED: putative F-box/LRR-repeat protein 23 [Nicotiana attenuata]OIT37822.1 putative f-boxlrr-repeat protein 23 [Nicotiana attenuata]
MLRPKRRIQKEPRGVKQKKLKASSSSSLPPPSSSLPSSPSLPLSPPPPWVELPLDITANILQRLRTIEILENAQRVCTAWWKASHDPTVWRVIDLRNHDVDAKTPRMLENMCRIAVDRSQGQLLKINIENFGSRDLLNYIAERSSQLRYLRFVKCYYILDGCLAAAVKNFPLLEELHIYFSDINKDHIEVIGHSCPQLKSFTLNARGFRGYQYDDEALAVARSMPELRHLSLFGNVLTNEGLRAILHGCPHLQSLDLRHCYNIKLKRDLRRRCRQQIVHLKHPRDSTYGYEFDAQICDYSPPVGDFPWSFDDHFNEFELEWW